METPSRYTFSPDGSTNVFQIPVQMKGDNYVRIDINDITVNDRNKFDIVNNSIVFVNVTDVPAGSKLDILVVQTDEGIANLGNVNSIDIVSQNITSINAVATDITAVVNNSNNMTAIQAVDANMPAVVNAAQAATDAAASEVAAKASENASKVSENASKVSENASKASEVAAENHKNGAAASATAANTSLSNTLAAELAAIQASADANTSKNAAMVSETNAASEATTATTKASEASVSAATAATSATNANTSETNAAASASSAQASKDAALAALDNFDDRYLGQKTSDPATDNDGDPLISGALYFNTTDDTMKVYDGSLWVAAYASLSGALLGANNLSDVANVAAARSNLGLDTGDNPTFAGLTTTADVSFGDNDKAIFGAGSDLEISADSLGAHIIATPSLEISSYDIITIGGNNSILPNMIVDSASGTAFLDSLGSPVANIPNNSLGTAVLNIDLDVNGTVTATSFAGVLQNVTETVLTTGTAATYTTPTDAFAIVVEVLGAGGGGGGVNGQGSNTAGCASAGGAGGYSQKTIMNPASSYTYTIGAGGAGGAAGTYPGSAGGTTSFTDGASVTLSGSGGNGGGPRTAGSNALNAGVLGGVASGGDLNIQGQCSGAAAVVTGDRASLSTGGSTKYGAGAVGTSSTGSSATGFGSGGGAASVLNTTANYAGGAGADGVIVITEYRS